MTMITEARLSDSPYVEAVMQGWTVSAGQVIRPAENHWHMVLTRVQGRVHSLVVGPWTTSGIVTYGADAEIFWIKFRLGSYMPHLPVRKFRNTEMRLPEAASKSFWLNGSAWQFPNFENADTFIDRLVRDGVLDWDPVVSAALQNQLPSISERTVRHRFLHATGLTQRHIRQLERAQQAAALLKQGVSILDTVHEAGYFDQPHLTRSLRQFIGYTPAQLFRPNQIGCSPAAQQEYGVKLVHEADYSTAGERAAS